MIKIILFVFVFSSASLSSADLSIEEIHHMIKKINEQRKGVDLKTLEIAHEPFIKIQREKNNTKKTISKKENTKLALHAIMNKKAYIDDSWRSVGDVIAGHTLMHVGKRGIVLKIGNKIEKLFLQKKENSLVIIKKGR